LSGVTNIRYSDFSPNVCTFSTLFLSLPTSQTFLPFMSSWNLRIRLVEPYPPSHLPPPSPSSPSTCPLSAMADPTPNPIHLLKISLPSPLYLRLEALEPWFVDLVSRWSRWFSRKRHHLEISSCPTRTSTRSSVPSHSDLKSPILKLVGRGNVPVKRFLNRVASFKSSSLTNYVNQIR
jgi:hypothetical protein